MSANKLKGSLKKKNTTPSNSIQNTPISSNSFKKKIELLLSSQKELEQSITSFNNVDHLFDYIKAAKPNQNQKINFKGYVIKIYIDEAYTPPRFGRI